MNPVFSIITITYNAEATVEVTLKSVAAQTYGQVEYIVVDGASSDGTMDIVGRYADHISKLVSKPDKGLYDAMNKGLSMATGDYVCFLNAGDRLHSEDTLRLMAEAVKTEAELPDVLYGQTAIVDAKGNFVRMRRLEAPERLTWKSFKDGMLVCHQSFYAKRKVAPAYNLHYKLSADFDWCVNILKQAKSTFNTGLVLTDYLQEGLTTQHRYASLIERFCIMSKHYGLMNTIARHLWFAVRLLWKR